MIDATGLTENTNPGKVYQLPEITEDILQGRLESGSHTAGVYIIWSLTIEIFVDLLLPGYIYYKAFRKH